MLKRRMTIAFAVLASISVGAVAVAHAADIRATRSAAVQSNLQSVKSAYDAGDKAAMNAAIDELKGNLDGALTANGPTTTAPTATSVATSSAPTTGAPATTAPKAATAPPTTATPTTVKSSLTTVKPASIILFEDDFNGATGALPDASKWVDYGSYCGGVDQPGFGYIRCGSDETLDGAGHLSVPATPTWGSGLQTYGKFGFTYGTMSAWIKTPSEKGYWPAFWTTNGTGKATVGEIDVLESYTTWPTISHAGSHAWNASGIGSHAGSDDNFCNAGVDLSKDFHKYSARVEPNAITFFVDDKQCGKTVTSTALNPWPFGPANPAKNFLMLDLAVGGAGGQQSPATANAQMLVDRVEVRSL